MPSRLLLSGFVRLDAPHAVPYSHSMAKRSEQIALQQHAPPALVSWQEQLAKWKTEAQSWVKARLYAYFETPESYEPKTTAEIMTGVLDTDLSMPTGYSRIVDSTGYAERYALVRNTLEGMARHKLVVIDSTLNSKGKESAAYARPVNAADEWQIVVNATDKDVLERALRGIREWLSIEGGVLSGVNGVMMARKAGGSGLYGRKETPPNEAADASRGNRGPRKGKRAAARSRKPRTTSGGD